MADELKDKKRRVTLSDAWHEARELVWAHRRRLALGGALMIVSRLAGFVLPVSSKFLIDDVINGGRTELLVPIAFGVGIAALIQAGTSFALSQLLGVAAQRAITDLRKDVQTHVSRLPVRFFDSTKTGVLISRIMTDAEGIRNLVGTGLVRLTGGVVTAALALAGLFILNWRLTLLILLVLGGFAGAIIVAFNKLRPIFRERGKLNADVTGRLGESLSGIRVVKAYTAERSERLVFAKGVHRLFRNIATAVTGVSAITAVTTAIVGVTGVIMILVGGRAVLAGTMTVGGLVTYVFLVGLVAMPLIDIAEIGTQVSEAFAGLDRIREIRRVATEAEEDRDRRPLGPMRGDLAFDDIWFEYAEGVPVLKGVSFESPAGSTTALVGPSGSGKSTLISLAMAFNRPTRGTVTVDGRDLSTIRLREYRGRLGVVLQENFLFDGSIAENIAFARPHATPEEIRQAAHIAHADEFIDEFEQGYETIVGERGVKLSGGQRQRIAIARAVLADPTILVLDEATSSLDSESEAKIKDGLRSLRRGRTTFVIAHRLSTIRNADQILVLDAGEIIERGTHRELMALGGRYRELHDRQYLIEEDVFVNPGEELGVVDHEAVKPIDERDVVEIPRNL